MTEKEKALAQDYKHTFGSEHGKRVYEDLMRECYMNEEAHDIDNVNLTYLLNGGRAVGLYIKSRFEADLSKKVLKITDSKNPMET